MHNLKLTLRIWAMILRVIEEERKKKEGREGGKDM